MYKIDRRSFLAHALTAGLVIGCGAEAYADKTASITFKHGVASGDPLHDRVILWTRVSPVGEAMNKPVSVSLYWEIAEDPSFKTLVNGGTVTTGPEKDYTVKVDADNLKAGTPYYYRFTAPGAKSMTGTTKTLPKGALDKARFAVVSCSHYGYGYFNVYKEIANQKDLDAVLHLGDYIYEYGNDKYSDKTLTDGDRHLTPDHELIHLNDYRQRYGLYRKDPDLQAVHAAHPFICIWDDHEFANDSWKEGAENHQPETEGPWKLRRQCALQVYREWIPIRDPQDGADPLRIYRRFDYGDLVSLMMLDTRIIGRDKQVDYLKQIIWQQMPFDMRPQAKGGKPVAITNAADLKTLPADAVKMVTVPFDISKKKPTPVLDWDFISSMDPKKLPAGYAFLPDAKATREKIINDPNRHLLGTEQADWLTSQLKDSKAKNVPWQLIGQQILTGKVAVPKISDLVTEKAMVPANIIAAVEMLGQMGLPYNMDAWDGYNASRERLFKAIKNHANNVVTLAGDTHNAWAFNLTPDGEEAPVAVELATSSVSSPGMEHYFANTNPEEMSRRFVALNRELVYQNSHNRGWVNVTVTPDETFGEWHYVSTVSDKTYQRIEGPVYRVKTGTHQLEEA